MGRRKVEMKRISNNSSRLVTFSKRRVGLFKKANEISTLCGAEVAIIIFSPGGKPFSFGQPNVEKVINKFYKRNRNSYDCEDDATPQNPRAKKARVQKLTKELTKLEVQIDQGSKRNGVIVNQGRKWKGAMQSINDLSSKKLVELEKKIKDASKGYEIRVNELEVSGSLLLLADCAST